MPRFLLILAAPTFLGLALTGCDPSNGQATMFASPQDQRVRHLEANLAAEQEKNAQLTKRCEQLTDEIAKLRWRQQQLDLQLQAIGDAPRQRDFLQRQTLGLTAEAEALRAQVIALGGTPPPPEPLPPLPSPRAASTSIPAAQPSPAFTPATAPAAPAAMAIPASRPATAPTEPQRIAAPAAAPEDVTP